MSHFGILGFPGTGHLHPLTAVGRDRRGERSRIPWVAVRNGYFDAPAQPPFEVSVLWISGGGHGRSGMEGANVLSATYGSGLYNRTFLLSSTGSEGDGLCNQRLP